MGSVAVDPPLSVVTRVVNLPLVSSTYDLMSSAYVNTKDQYPYLKSVCEMAEKGVKTITSVALTSALPIIQKLEPQIAIANTYACKGLDRMEERLPILNQPSTQVSLEQNVSCGYVPSFLQVLPINIEFARKNVHNANQKIQDAQDKLCLSWVEWKRSVGYDDTDESHCAEHIESRTLAIARNLTQQLQTTCHTLLSNIQGLPQNIQDQAKHIGVMAGDIYSVFRSAASFKEVSDSLLTSSKGQLQKMKESLDDVMDYFVNNTPLNWLVFDFTTIDLASETDEIPDIIALEEENRSNHSHANGFVPSWQNGE
ncbi:perilipin-2 [Sapajus apella]|uniref:Perilipin-2 n=1 Tax=Sapajus apella TaxID=9515 RepID=A0A6J3JNG6_SAPAP|nr:perilipin-2 [Sapajus apella]